MSDEASGRQSRPVEARVGPVAVLAGTYAQFLDYASNHPKPKPVFCDRWPTFAGLEFSAMVEVGSFRQRQDALDIYQRVAPMVRPND